MPWSPMLRRFPAISEPTVEESCHGPCLSVYRSLVEVCPVLLGNAGEPIQPKGRPSESLSPHVWAAQVPLRPQASSGRGWRSTNCFGSLSIDGVHSIYAGTVLPAPFRPVAAVSLQDGAQRVWNRCPMKASNARLLEKKLQREEIANRGKHWVRLATACNSRCVFCLDMDTPRNVFLPFDEVAAELRRGRDTGADKVILSGGEGSLHPRFFELIRYSASIGYDRVQTVTNGWQFADRSFYRSSVSAGLGEITFSLHGHTQELHDRLTRHPGSFKRLIKGMVRAVRDPNGPIVNVDVVINKQNVPHLDKIIELCVSLGVREFDLLHVIPQAEAFRNRDELFYDIRDHEEILHKVFRLNRHPGFTIWTNRFPVSYLEGLEDLIQDPHKMLDEVNGRRFQVRRYLDRGEPLDCRQPERCEHCFIEPFCTTMERFVSDQNSERFDVWELPHGQAVPEVLPFGCHRMGLSVSAPSDVADADLSHPLEVGCASALPLPRLDHDIRWLATTPEQLEAWLPGLHSLHSLEISLTGATAAWMLENRSHIEENLPRIRIHQPSYERLRESVRIDARNPRDFFERLGLPVQTSGLPACLAPGSILAAPARRMGPGLFKEGRLDIGALSKRHIREGYFAKSRRCSDCQLDSRCDGIHINMVRDQGLELAVPLSGEGWPEEALQQLKERWAEPPRRIRHGLRPQPPAVSLPGFGAAPEPPRDPLAVLALEAEARLAEKREARAAARKEREG
jgi:MoaA/NifB/PqqE/SkfB family radical SAM enzyme